MKIPTFSPRDGRAQSLLAELQKIRVRQNNAPAFAGAFNDYFPTLVSNLNFPPDIVPTEHERHAWRALISAGFMPLTYENYYLELEKSFADHRATKPIKYKVLAQLSITSNTVIPPFVINGGRVTFPRHFMANELEARSHLEHDAVNSLRHDAANFCPVVSSIAAKSPLEALYKGKRSLELIHAIWNFYFNRQIVYRSNSGISSQLNRVLFGPIFSLHDLNGKLAAETFSYTYEVSSVRLKVEQHQLVVGGWCDSSVGIGLQGAC